jgi:hypothetical protein
MSCRAKDFHSIGGFDPNLQIMEVSGLKMSSASVNIFSLLVYLHTLFIFCTHQDADLCLRLHRKMKWRFPQNGSKKKKGDEEGYPSHVRRGEEADGDVDGLDGLKWGRVRMLGGHTAITSGRRVAELGNLYGTYVQAMIGIKWFFGSSYEELRRVYNESYSDKYR